MKLAIVVPVLNEAATLVARLQALAPLRSRGAELLVVDGGSSDGTMAMAQPLADQLRKDRFRHHLPVGLACTPMNQLGDSPFSSEVPCRRCSLLSACGYGSTTYG